MFSKESRYQVLATLCVNIITVCSGFSTGWTSANLLILHSNDTPLSSGPLTAEQGSWIGSLIALGGLIGSIFFGWLSGLVGRKFILLAAVLPLMMGWLLIYFAVTPVYLYAARMLHGFGSSAIYMVMPVFVTEIADSRIRGALGSMFMLACNLGILLAFVAGHVCSYETQPLLLMGGCVAYLGGVLCLPDTPQYLLRIGKQELAEKSLRFYRNARTDNKEQNERLASEMETMRSATGPASTGEADDRPVAITWRDFCTPHARKALAIGVFLQWLKTFAGLTVMVTYAGQIFAAAGSSMSPNAAAIVVGAIQLAGTWLAIVLVDRAGRRVLLAISTVGTGLSLVMLATYMLLRQWGWPLVGLGWVPVCSFSAVMFLGSCGIVPMPFVVMAEVLPPQIRSYGSSIGMIVLWALAFVLMKAYAAIVATVGMAGSFYVFAGCSFLGTAFVAVYLPETKGKSFEEIRHVMVGRPRGQ